MSPIVLGNLLITLSLATASHDTTFITLCQADSGSVWWYGHELAPPYIVEAAFVLRPDTTWLGLFVNRLPLEPPPKHQALSPTAAVRANRISQLIGNAAAVADEMTQNGSGRHQMLEAVATFYRRAPDVVDSVSVVDDEGVNVFFRGISPAAVYCDFRSERVEQKRSALISFTESAGDLCASLNGGTLVMIARGLLKQPRSRVPQVKAEIDSLRRGLKVTQPTIKLQSFVEPLRNPRPIADILKGED